MASTRFISHGYKGICSALRRCRFHRKHETLPEIPYFNAFPVAVSKKTGTPEAHRCLDTGSRDGASRHAVRHDGRRCSRTAPHPLPSPQTSAARLRADLGPSTSALAQRAPFLMSRQQRNMQHLRRSDVWFPDLAMQRCCRPSGMTGEGIPALRHTHCRHPRQVQQGCALIWGPARQRSRSEHRY